MQEFFVIFHLKITVASAGALVVHPHAKIHQANPQAISDPCVGEVHSPFTHSPANRLRMSVK
jgi:hypothetical protein